MRRCYGRDRFWVETSAARTSTKRCFVLATNCLQLISWVSWVRKHWRPFLPVIKPSDSSCVSLGLFLNTFNLWNLKALVQVFGDQRTTVNNSLDGERDWLWVQLPYPDSDIYYSTASVSAGLHLFSGLGNYSLFVTGQFGSAAYGFIPAFNRK